MSNYTIQKSALGGAFSVLKAGNTIPVLYPNNSYMFVPNEAAGTFSLINATNRGDAIVIDQKPSDIVNGETGSAFADLNAVYTYVQTNFFLKAGGGAGDQVVEVADFVSLPITGAAKTIYLVLSPTPVQYRWSGSQYVRIDGTDLSSYVTALQLSVQLSYDYVVSTDGTNITATPKSAAKSTFTGTDAYTVIQAAITALQTGAGGSLYVASGTYNLTNEVVTTGIDTLFNPLAQVTITGNGYSTIFVQNTSGKNAFVYKNKAAMGLVGCRIVVGSLAKSGIFGDDTGVLAGNLGEISIYEGTIDKVKIDHSGTAPGMLLKNIFNLSVPHIDVISTTNHGIEIQGTSTHSQNYGNANFGFVHSNGSTATGFAGLALISDVASHPINLMNFNTVCVGAGFYGVYFRGVSSCTFGLADIENTAKPIYMDNGAAGVNVGNNVFSNMYLYTSIGGTAIFCASNTYGNKFTGRIESDDATLTCVSDAQQFQAANSYDLTLGYSIGATPTVTIATPTQTVLCYRKVFDGLTVLGGPMQANPIFNSIKISGPRLGSTTLVAGTKTVAIPSSEGVTASSEVFVSLKTPGGTMGARVKGVGGTNQIFIVAVDATGNTVTTDTSTIIYHIIG